MLLNLVKNDSPDSCELKYGRGMECCPNPDCGSDNICNEDDGVIDGKKEISLEVTCHDCSLQWVEIHKNGHCIEIYPRDGDD